MKKIIFSFIMTAAAVTAFNFYSCGGRGGTAATGSVALYITDAPMPMDVFTQVTATVNRVQLLSAGTATAVCDVLTTPVTVNLANLSDVMQLVNIAQCTAGPFNRIHVEFDKSVQLMSGPTGTVSLCSFGSFKDQGSGSQPDILQCDAASGTCVLDINGAVNVLAQHGNKMALDFSLKDFAVDLMTLGTSSCSVTMMVSPLNASDMNARHDREAVTGIVSRLSTTNKTFDLTRGDRTFGVLYSSITDTGQPGIGILLQRAQNDALRTRVTTSDIDVTNNQLTASAIMVKVEGLVSNLVSGVTFSVSYAGGTKSILVDYSAIAGTGVEGVLADGEWVDVKLFGYSGMNDVFLARKIEVESQGMMTED